MDIAVFKPFKLVLNYYYPDFMLENNITMILKICNDYWVEILERRNTL